MTLDTNDLPEPDEVLELKFDLSDVVLDTLSGDVRDNLLGIIKTRRVPWHQLREAEQNDLAAGLATASKELVRKVVQAMTAWDVPRAVGRIGAMKVVPGDKSRIDVTMSFSRIDDNLTALGRHVGDMAVLVMVDSEDLMGEKSPVRVDPDQPGLPMGDGTLPGASAAADALEPQEGDDEEDEEERPDPRLVLESLLTAAGVRVVSTEFFAAGPDSRIEVHAVVERVEGMVGPGWGEVEDRLRNEGVEGEIRDREDGATVFVWSYPAPDADPSPADEVRDDAASFEAAAEEALGQVPAGDADSTGYHVAGREVDEAGTVTSTLEPDRPVEAKRARSRKGASA